jgi:hypothetical protein
LPPEPPPISPIADAHANASQVATDAGVDHAVAATEANQEAARKTAEAAQKAKTEAERAAAAASAAKVLEREKQIAAAWANFGVGQCGARPYPGVTARVRDTLLAKLHEKGMTVTGNNPWVIETHEYGVRLRAVWDPKTLLLKLIVTAGKGSPAAWGLHTVTCEDIWDKIDPILKEVIGV